MDTNRVSKELREIASDGASGVSVELVGDSLAHMRGTITGASHNRDDDVFFSVFFRVWCNEIQNIIIVVVVACRLDRNTNSRQNAVVLSLLLLLRDRSVRDAVPRRDVFSRHSHHERVPIRTAKDEILDQSVAPERVVAKRRDMSRRVERSVDTSADD